MMGAVFSEMDEGCAARRRFAEESIAQAASLVGSAAPVPSYGGTAEEHAERNSTEGFSMLSKGNMYLQAVSRHSHSKS